MDNKPKKGYGYIYKYTSPSGKSYIGQTVRSLKERAGHNGKNYLGCTFFWRAIQKYGFSNFEVEILAEVPRKQLDSKEKYYIQIFNTLVPNGYNLQEGGKTKIHDSSVPVYSYYMNSGLPHKMYCSEAEAARQLGVAKSTISNAVTGKIKSCAGFYWSKMKMEKYPIKERPIDNSMKKVRQLDLQNNLIATYDSISQAAEKTSCNRSAIKKVCRHELKTAGGFKWECEEILLEKKYNNSPKTIQQIDSKTNSIIQVFPSISAAARSFGKETSLLRRVLNTNSTAYGYKWKTTESSTTKDL